MVRLPCKLTFVGAFIDDPLGLGFTLGFGTGTPLGTCRTLCSDFFKERVRPPSICKTSVSGLKPSIFTLPSW